MNKKNDEWKKKYNMPIKEVFQKVEEEVAKDKEKKKTIEEKEEVR